MTQRSHDKSALSRLQCLPYDWAQLKGRLRNAIVVKLLYRVSFCDPENENYSQLIRLMNIHYFTSAMADVE